MAPFRPSSRRAAGVLLALASALASPRASGAEAGATAAAPASCAAEQFALRAYVIALKTGDVTSGARDAGRIEKVMTPLCRQAMESGRWPGLTQELLAHAAEDPTIKAVTCALAPPEAWPAIMNWEVADDDTRSAYEVPCALALLRHRPEDFTRLVVPRLGSKDGCRFPDLAARLGEALAPDQRLQLLPALDLATQVRARGRDWLYRVLCEHPAARAQPICQAPALLEPGWAHDARIRRATPGIAVNVGGALLFLLAAFLLRHLLGSGWPAAGMSAVASAVTCAAAAWIVVSSAPGDGALSVLNLVLAAVVAPVVGVIAAALAWSFIRRARGAALPWCVVHAVAYAAMTAVHGWNTAPALLC